MRVAWISLVFVMIMTGVCFADDKVQAGTDAAQSLGFDVVGKYGSEGGAMSNLINPFMEGTMMMTLDDDQAGYTCPDTGKYYKKLDDCSEKCELECVQGFSVSDVFSDRSVAFLEVTIAPSGGGDIFPVFVKLDTDLDGAYDHNTQVSAVVSGVCSDGIISCDSGTWSNCLHYAWTANDNLQVSLESVLSTEIGGCFCINNSCGNGLVFRNIDTILKKIGDGIVMAVQAVEPRLIVKRANTDTGNMRIIYYGVHSSDIKANTGKNADIASLDYDISSGIDNPEQYYSAPHLLQSAGSDELSGQTMDASSLWALSQQAENSGIERKACTIGYDIDYSTTWSCLITCYISNAGETFLDSEITRSSNVPGICAMAYDRCSSGLYGEYYGDAPYDFGGGYMPCTPSGETKTHCESGGNTWSLAGTYGYPMPGGVCYARDSYGTRTGSQCPENIIPAGTEVVGVDQYPYVHMIGQHTAGLYCIRKTFYQGYVDNYYCSLAHEGAEQIGTDHSNLTTVDSCSAIDQNKCVLSNEEICDKSGNCINTIVNGNPTGFTGIESCMTVSSEKTTYSVCLTSAGQIVSRDQQTGEEKILANDVDGWRVNRTYSCSSNQAHDYDGMISRAATIEEFFSADGSMAYATYTDTVLGNTDVTTILMTQYGDCEYQCKVRNLTDKTTANAVAQQGQYLTETSSFSEYSRVCKLESDGSYLCVLDDDEEMVSDCACMTDFLKAVTGINLAKEVSQDIICAGE